MSTVEASDFDAVLDAVLAVLEAEHIPYLMTGALVRNVYGDVRTSRDLDVVVHPDHAEADGLRRLFEDAGISVEGPRQSELGRRLVLGTSPIPTDVWLAPDTPFHRGEFERAVTRTFGRRELVLMHPQDFVLRKLVNERVRSAAHDIDDAYQVLLYAWDDIDVDALVASASAHRVATRAAELVALVRRDREALEKGQSPDDV